MPTTRRHSLRSRLATPLLAVALAWAGLASSTPQPAGAAAFPTYVAMAERPDGAGRWLLRSDGSVETQGTIPRFGDVAGAALNGAPLDIVATPSGGGYWILGADGGIFTFGDAKFYGSTGAVRLNRPIVGMGATPSGHGYWLVATDGGIFTFGDANFYGSTGALRLNRPIVDMATTPSGHGYWLVATDGGIFTFGDANFYGSTGALRLNQPIVDISSTISGDGYWMTALDGGIFSFGSAPFRGAGVNRGSNATAMTTTSAGYAQLLANGQVVPFPGSETLAPHTPPTQGPHAFLFQPSPDLAPARWNACAIVRIEVNYAGSGNHAQAAATLQQAIDRARAATGLDIRIVGQTSATTRSPNADAIIRWGTSTSQGGTFGAGILGYGGGSYTGGANPRIVAGEIIFNGSVPLSAGIGSSSSFGVLALHELGHMLGLAHIGDTAQVMYPSMRAHTGYNSGDLEGLWWLGASQGCVAPALETAATFGRSADADPIPFGTWD